MSVNDTPPTGGSTRRRRQGAAPDHRQPRPAASPHAVGSLRRARPTRAHRARPRRRGADRRGQADLPTSCITCHGANLQGVRIAGRRWSASGRPRSTSRCPRAACRRPRTARRCRARSRSSRRSRSRPSAPSSSQRAAARSSRRAGLRNDAEIAARRRALPAELRLLPQLHRAGRRPVPGQVRAQPRPGHRRADLGRDAQRAAEHAEVRQRPAHAGGEGGDHPFIQDNKATIDPGGYAAGGFGPAPEGLIAFLVGMGAIVAAVLWMGSRT